MSEERANGNSSPLPCSPAATVEVRRLYDGWGVQFSVGVQHFDIGPQDYESEREAEWMATMFRNALNKANNAVRGAAEPRTLDGLVGGLNQEDKR